MSDIYCVAGQELLKVLAANGFITEDDIIQKCHRLRHPRHEIYAAVCGTLEPEEQCLLKHLLNKIDGAKARVQSSRGKYYPEIHILREFCAKLHGFLLTLEIQFFTTGFGVIKVNLAKRKPS